ncbi:type II secretion system protein GspL [Rhizobacter sp. Root404]|uniref:type II secretion system protein GspL n=1 Tax=Rhizobacter sp. Root404 TaxID=1736528 RepID=UPI0006FEF9DB|nr:type II secretion system protein GspL [Rhizobacter sp. Root404]KQW40073.1 general secretion pathway protein GspL [Rhizobacter sp. Root404]
MSTLVVQIPSRSRLRSSVGAVAPENSDTATDYVYVTSPDGLVLETQGHCAASLLPKATSVVAVLADTDVSWHRITLPKAPAARLRAALGGVLEDALLEDAEDVHLALAPNAVAGAPTWVAAVSRRWLRGELAALEKAEVFVDRVVPMAWPDEPPIGHFAETEVGPNGAPHGIALHWAHADGVASVRLQGGLARALVPQPAPAETRWSATPGAVAAAEQWLGGPVRVMAPGQRLLQAARSLWNLRQFDLARRNRGVRALRDSARKFFSPAWRPVRWGLATLVVAQILGLNLWAWHQRGAIESRQQAMQGIVRSAFPNANPQDIQRDADAVMQREAQALRTLAGKPGETDLEPMMQAAASAWPADRPPVETIRFEPGRLTLSATGWTDEQIAQFRSLLRPGGWAVETAEGRLVMSRMRPGAAS